MDQDRKKLERNILDHFREHYTGFPKGKIMPSESPDFIIKISPKRSLGIELSSLPSSSYEILDKKDLQKLLSDIHHILRKKKEKLRLYRKNHADQYWLILFVDSLLTGNFNVSNQLEKLKPGGAYDRVFLFELFEGRIYLHN